MLRFCAFTTNAAEPPLFSVRVDPNERNGQREACALMVDKLTTIPRVKPGARIGCLDDENVLRLNQALLVFLGLARSPRSAR